MSLPITTAVVLLSKALNCNHSSEWCGCTEQLPSEKFNCECCECVCKFRSLEAKERHDHKMIIWSKDGCSNKPSNTHYLVVWVADMAKIFYYGILLV